MNKQYKTPGFIVSLTLHGGLAALLLGQQPFDSIEATAALPLNMNMFEMVQQVTPSVEPMVSEEVVEEVPTPPEDVAVPEPEYKPEPKPEPVVKTKKKIVKPKKVVKKQVKPSPDKRPQKPKPQVAKVQPAAASMANPVNTEVGIAASSSSGEKDLIRQMYKQRLLKTIAAHKYYPKRAQRRHIEGKVQVGFVVMQDGVIKDIRLADSSGKNVLDKAALDALRRAGQFEPLPTELGLTSWTFVVPLDYRIL